VNGDNTTDDIDIRSATQNITGGTLQMGSAATAAVNDISMLNGAGGQMNLWNLVLTAGIAKNTLMRSPTNVLNDLTIQTLNNLAPTPNAGIAIKVGTGNTSGNWTNNGTFTQTDTTVTLTGTSNTQAIGGTSATTFNNLVINKASNNLTINTTPTINGTLTFTNGQIVTGVNRVILGTAATIVTPSATSYVAGSLQKNYAAGANLSFFAGNDFPVGDAANFTPVNVSAGVTSTAGSLTVSTTAGDHPQVTTPIPSTGIDANNSENRYWSFNNAGLTLTTNLTATFTFIGTVGADVDATANTGAFIVQRYDGTNWTPTTIGTLTAASTQASNITLSAGNNDFAIGDPLSGFNGNPGGFNAFETSTASGAVLGRLFTKLKAASTFAVDIVAISNNAVNPAPATTALTVDVIDASPIGGTLTAASNCRTTWTTVIQTQTVPAVVAWVNGRITVNITAPVNAVRNARIRVTQGALIGCSTDNFAIRPQAFTVTSTNATQTGASGAPAIKTGANFNLTATSVAGYDGTPNIDNTKVIGSPNAGTIGGVFGAAPVGTGTATGASFFYSEVGNFGLNANAVNDSSFTAVDLPNDCVAGFSNTLAGGKYGCSIGSPAVAQTTGSSGFGRFIPDNFNVNVNAPAVGTACGTFTYVGQPFSYTTAPAIVVTARNGTTNGLTNATTSNYAGSYMKITNATLTPNTTAARYSRFDALGGGTTPALDTTGAPAAGSDPAIGTFVSGVGALTFNSGTGLAFTRGATASSPFNADIALLLNIIDGDGVAYASNPVSFGAATAGNGIAFSGGKAMRYGRLRISNTYGSELLPLPVNITAQYWNGLAYLTNTADSCTSLASTNFTQAAGSGGVINTTLQGGGTMANGTGTITLTKPTGFTAKGSVTLNVSAGATFLPYLPGIAGLETFGIYKDAVIYRREIY
jgi:MSHA biogenesis protein MshQ